MSGSIDPNVLNALAHPATVNLLQDYQGAAQAANSIWANREWQAKQAAGAAQQGGIDENGQYQPATALQNLKAAGPGAALAVPQTLTNNQALSGAQTEQGIAVSKTIASALAPLVNAPDGQIHDLLNQTAHGLIGSGVPSSIVMGVISRLPADPAHMKQQIELARQAFLPPEQQQGSIYGRPITVDNGQGIGGGTQSQTSGALTMAGQPVPTGFPSRTQALEQVGQPATAEQAAALHVPVGTVITGPMLLRWQQQGAGPNLTGNLGGGGAPGSASGATPASSPPVPSPIPGGGVYRPRGGAAPADAGTAAAPAAGAPAPGAMRPVTTSLPPGAAEDVALYKADQAALPAKQTSDQNLAMARQALALTSSGKSAETTHALFGYLQSAGLLTPGATDELKNYEVFRKLAERRVAELGNAAGTDAGRSLAAQSNAGVSLSTPANMEILRNDVGKNRQQMAATMAEDPNGSGVGYGQRRADVSAKTDFRGFAWSMYSPQEQAKILAGVKGNPAADARLHRAIGMAQSYNLDRGSAQ